VPTRLLDWTKNPLAALWFAVKEVPEGSEDGVVLVWQFDSGRCCDIRVHNSPFDCQETFVFQPSHVHRRLSAQFGWFTVHPFVDGKYQPVGTLRPGERYWELRIAASSFADLRSHLDRCGVNNSTMFPGMDGLCQHIQWIHTRLADEIV
jgi:hypothetical protein